MKSSLATWLAALLALLAVPALVFAQDDEDSDPANPNDPGYRFYEAQAKKVLKSAGDKIWQAAEKGIRNGLHGAAFPQVERVLKFDPDHEEAREYLGYEKKKDAWVLNAELAGKVKKVDTRGEKMSEQALIEKREKWQDEEVKKAEKFLAGLYAKLGDICQEKGHPKQARKGYEAALRLDPDCEKARKGLGYKRLGKVWITRKQEEAVKAAGNGAEFKRESEWDDLFKTTLNKVETVHFEVESPFPVADLLDYIKACETAYAYYLTDLGMDPAHDAFDGRKARFCVMGDEDQWNKYVDAYGGPDKEFTRKMGGTANNAGLVRGIRNSKGSEHGTRKDMMVHGTIHFLNHHVFKMHGEHGSWADEGLSYYYTIKVLESTRTHCVSLKKGDYDKPGDEGGEKVWDDSDNWKPLVKEMARKKNDVPLRTLIYKPITTLVFFDTIKSWSIITWLMDTDRDKFIDYLDQMRTNGENQEAILQGIYGKGIEDLDEEWRAFVVRNF